MVSGNSINDLRGKWFHTIKEDGNIQYQGQILEVYERALLCQLYEFGFGEASDRVLLGISNIKMYIYETVAEMRDNYDWKLGRIHPQQDDPSRGLFQ